MRVLICGGRDFNDKNLLHRTFCEILPWYEPDDYGNSLPKDVTIIHGAAHGADQLADEWAVVHWCGIEEFPADWKHFGKAAGPIRNQQMIDEGKPDLVIAFPGGRGTADMVKRAHRAGVPVHEVSPKRDKQASARKAGV